MPTVKHKIADTPYSQELFSAETFLGNALQQMKSAPVEERGAVYTRGEVVSFMLDLIGYTADRPLWDFRLLEPSFGGGEFLLQAVARLFESIRGHDITVRQLSQCICAVELHRASFDATRHQISQFLISKELSPAEAAMLTDAWLINGDFLLALLPSADFVVGNPPYVRQELIPEAMLAEYRQRYATLYDRADLYVPFMERSLQLLKPGGQMCFICSDRWMKNRYGGPLRTMIASSFSLRYYVDMVGTDAFQSEVVAYPAITVIQRGGIKRRARIAHRPEVSALALAKLHRALTGPSDEFNGTVSEIIMPSNGDEPWLLESDALPSLELVRRLEAALPTLEGAGCTVGIGVATGADKIFIGKYDELDVEDERKLPLATTRDILTGSVEWRGLGVINPFEDDGALADFNRYPRFAALMSKHQAALKARHCATRANGSWYRTIDRITPSLALKPKLLIPDIKGTSNIVLEDGRLYPHHNLYFITSDCWPLPALQAVLQSGIARLFVRAYSTKMRGGCLRFQAQYLRRIRLPRWTEISPALQRKLQSSAAASDAAGIINCVAAIYGLGNADIAHLTA